MNPEIDKYISKFPEETKQILIKLRQLIFSIAPEAEEVFAYGIPTFRVRGEYLVHYAGYTHHIGLYPTGAGLIPFQEEIAGFKHAKGSVQFPLNQPIPYELIEKIVRHRLDSIKG